MTAAIEVENLSKEYRVGDLNSFDTLRDKLAHVARGWMNGRATDTAQAVRTHRALDNVSFNVAPGEVLGIIGRNGAGKSTLLKILARVTAPTSGRAIVRGRLAPLLEVGTGFNTELTGRENIYVNGTLLGMSPGEINAKLDEIIEFAGVAKYIDTPVKRYSSGMVVRLGFAIAAHLEPEILIVDEVLAVGDAAFQSKCLGKMNQAAQLGRTVLFVSHNLASVKALCNRAIWIDDGRLRGEGDVGEVVGAYLRTAMDGERSSQSWPPVAQRRGVGHFYFTDVRVVDEQGNRLDPVMTGQDIRIELDYRTTEQGRVNGHTQIWLINNEGSDVAKFGTELAGTVLPRLSEEGTIVCRIPRFPFAAGAYSLRLNADLGNSTSDEVDRAISFSVVNGDFYPGGNLPPPQIPFLCDHSWTLCESALRDA